MSDQTIKTDIPAFEPTDAEIERRAIELAKADGIAWAAPGTPEQGAQGQPGELVERILGLGFGPDLSRVQTGPFEALGRVTQVEHYEQLFLVAASRDAEEISLQEIRSNMYDTAA